MYTLCEPVESFETVACTVAVAQDAIFFTTNEMSYKRPGFKLSIWAESFSSGRFISESLLDPSV